MKKKNIIMVATLAALATLGGTTALTVQAKGGFGVFATAQLNEYGCVSNCTAEYYPSDLSRRVKADNTLIGTQNVRVIARVSQIDEDKGRTFFQDIDYSKVIGSTLDESYFKNNKLIHIKGIASGLSGYKAGDTVAFYGEVQLNTLSFGRWTAEVVEINNPIFYQIGDRQNLDLLVDPVYLQ